MNRKTNYFDKFTFCIVTLSDKVVRPTSNWQRPAGFSLVQNIYTNLHTLLYNIWVHFITSIFYYFIILYNIWVYKYYFTFKQLKTHEFSWTINVFCLETVKNCLRLSLARFSRKMVCLPLQENLANESLGNCNVGQVYCILTICCRLGFQLLQSEVIHSKCWEEFSQCFSTVDLFSNFLCLSRNIFVC